LEVPLLSGFADIALFLIVAIVFTLVMVLIPVALRMVGPSKPNAVKNSTFECGMRTIGKTLVRFNFRYYFYALMFITLDILVVFLYPWATSLKNRPEAGGGNIPGIGVFGLTAVVIFIAIIIVGYLYAWKKKVLEWK
jgi:NADH:ubiquinone oxidoreductase subunit 3 (subunit A)